MASDFPVDPDTLRKLLKKSRAMPIAFGYNDGTNDEDDEYLAAHARKDPEMLGKIAKTEGAGTKSAYGSFAVEGSEVHLTCFRSTPQLAKKFKKYLKKNKITLNVVVMDPSGAVIDSDVEKLDDWFQELEDANDLAEDAAEAIADLVETAAGGAAGAPGASARDAEAATLAARLRTLQPQVAAAPPAAADRLASAFKAVIALIRAGETRGAATTIGQIEAILARLAANAPAASPTPTPTATPAADPRLPRLREAVDKLAAQVRAVMDDAGGPLLAEVARARTLIDAGEAEAALTALRAVQATVKLQRAARSKWDRALALIEAPVSRAIALRGPADPDDLRAIWQRAVGLAGAGTFDRALAALPEIVAVLRAARATADAEGTSTA